ncbi:MAG: T9SS type B sorting domain-containing protein, partial [Flavitalea sp.]
NDKFTIKAQGIQKINNLRIFNRWGEIIFERKDFNIGDPNGAWNGLYKGVPAPGGAYVYMIELSCNDNIFIRKGTVTVVY